MVGRFGDRVDCVQVVLLDESAPDGLGGNRCRIKVAVRGRMRVVLFEQVGSSVEAAVEGVVDRVGRAVARRLEPTIEPSRRPLPPAPRNWRGWTAGVLYSGDDDRRSVSDLES